MNDSNALRKNLHKELLQYRGSMSEIARRCDCTREWVRKVVLGIYPDDELLVVAVEVLKERQTKRAEVNKMIASVVGEQLNMYFPDVVHN